MSQVILFHSAQEVRDDVLGWAKRLRAAMCRRQLAGRIRRLQASDAVLSEKISHYSPSWRTHDPR